MNINAPLFKKIQKIGRYFNAKPLFLDVDNNNKIFLRPYKKHRADILRLIFIHGVPVTTAYMFMDLKFKKYKEENVFIGVYKNENMAFIVSYDGVILAYIKEDNTTYRIYEDDNSNQTYETIIYKHHKNLDDIIKEYKEKYSGYFKIADYIKDK